MNKEFELKRLRLELLKVSTSKAELEFRIEERLEDIKRIKEHIFTQEKRELELEEQINKLKG